MKNSVDVWTGRCKLRIIGRQQCCRWELRSAVLMIALVAQLAERILGKDEVGSSNLLGGSMDLGV